MSDLFTKLRAPFPADRVSWRVGSTTADKRRGLALAYIDARDVMDRLDDVLGPDNWQCDYPHANGKTVCRIGLRINSEWVWKADGAGDTDVEAEKGALSDAFKRAGVRWGIGRYLYDVQSPWVELEAAGRSYRIKDTEYPKLARLLIHSSQERIETVTKARFIADAREHIEGETDGDKLAAWWKSPEQSQARRDANLESSEVGPLKDMVIDRINELRKVAA